MTAIKSVPIKITREVAPAIKRIDVSSADIVYANEVFVMQMSAFQSGWQGVGGGRGKEGRKGLDFVVCPNLLTHRSIDGNLQLC